MWLLEVLATEPDLLLRLLEMLEPRDLATLESTCTRSRQLYREFSVWRRRFLRLSETRFLGTDWAKRLGPQEGEKQVTDYKSLVGKVARLGRQWGTGPVREHHLDFGTEPVAEVAMDEVGLVVGLRRGEVRLYRRWNLEMLWARDPVKARVSRLALSPSLVVVVPLLPPALPTVHILARSTGLPLKLLLLAHPVTTILCGDHGCTLFSFSVTSHSLEQDQMMAERSQATCYRLSSPPPGQHLDVDLLYHLPVKVDTLSLSPCRTKFLAAEDSQPCSLSLRDLQTGAVLVALRPSSPTVAPTSGWRTHGLGWLDPGHVWVAWRNLSDTNLPYSAAVLDLGQGGQVTFQKVQWEGGATNWRHLLLLSRNRHLVPVGPEGLGEERDAALALDLKVNLRHLLKLWADACGLLHYGTWVLPHLGAQRGNVLVLQEFA